MASEAVLLRNDSNFASEIANTTVPVLVDFWAEWCGPCRQEFPALDEMYRKYKPMGFTMIGVNVEPDSAEAAKWLKATPVTFPILFDTKSEVSKLYSVASMPST